ncbi:hypothetical protein [Nostoc sp. 106C]|jgi:hypothetical protein|uniref:hypothetical protein n=1 Tax=Nostoc sp. 106C TaxID=1932667 RepID=UPI000A3C2CC1|nr:hypothetical protein [Nostoc sp. 106C]OUL20223.1 hypothetical protein BV375_31315 [Nostoc sp. 106C]OUL27130.1 hypothetical protein BV378_10715 [Nostoc sp. RF31YmG]
MDSHVTAKKIDWNPILCQIKYTKGHNLPTYTGDLKTALLNHAGLTNHSKGEEAYQLAREIARLTTYSDPEIVYWFSRLISLIND